MKKWMVRIMATVLTMIMTILITPPTSLKAEEAIPALPETLTGMDENGNVYEIEDENGTVESAGAMSRSGTMQVVNFNTKGFTAVTEYKEVETGISGYTCGAYGADAAYLGTNGTKVQFMLSGVIGEVEASEVQVLSKDSVSSLSHYIVKDGKLIHNITTNLNYQLYASVLTQGPAPAYLSEGQKYYSYDGHYFYTENNFDVMLSDYINGTRESSVNSDSPYYNYFQYLPLRSKSLYSGSELDTMIANKTSDTSKMRNLGSTFVEKQNTYGVNALLMAGVAANESAWGTSSIATTKNNLFGLNAVDSSPTESANYYSDVATCVKDFAETYMSKQYLNPNNWKHYGGFLGNKGSGINVKYASDPYWGEKAANVAWTLDYANGNQDRNNYTIGIKDTINSEHTALNIRNEATTSSVRLYRTGEQSSQAFLILGEETGFYKIQSDPVLNSDRTAIDDSTGNYNFTDMYAYASADYITKVIEGKGVVEETWEVNGINTSVSSPQPLATEIKLTADVSGATDNLQYKFVWQKDNWAEWGVIQEFSSNNTVTWKPESGGEYTLYLNVKESGKATETVEITYSIKSWGFESISTSVAEPQRKGTTIQITPQIVGTKTGLQYKFTWQKENWADWGVLQAFSTKSTAKWTPTEIGNYTLYVDVKDANGYVITKTITFEIKEIEWSFDGITVDKTSPGALGSTFNIEAEVSHPDSTVQYKFVWQKNNWAEWGVIRDFSSDNSVEWTPKSAGEYYIHVDVRGTGRVESKNIPFKIVQNDWKISNISSSLTSPQRIGKAIKFTVGIDGISSGFQYKFVWQKNNWASWGVLQEFSNKNYATWEPSAAGNYEIIVNVKDSSGKVKTESIKYEIVSKDWELEKVTLDKTTSQEVGTDITITPVISGNAEGLLYKFVWQKDNWASWDVIQNFSENASAVWCPEEPGTYNLGVDVKDSNGKNLVTKWIKYTVLPGTWEIAGMSFDLESPQIPNTEIEIASRIIGNKVGLQYKFVWQKDNWASWGVIQEGSTSTKATWKPTSTGNYKIYMDVYDKSGKRETFIEDYVISDWSIITKPLNSAAVGNTVTISVEETKNSSMQYKFVWQKDNWKSWGVIQAMSDKKSATWLPEEKGTYTLMIDGKDTTTGKITTKSITYVIK